MVATGRAVPGKPFVTNGCLAGRPQPQRGLGRLDRLVDQGQQVGPERVGVDLLAQPDRERLARR